MDRNQNGSNVMKKNYFVLVISVVGLLMFVGFANAQCIATVTDTGCDPSCDCISTTNCNSTTFTVPSNGNYCLSVKNECDGEYRCQNCNVCANIYRGDNFIANCHRTDCNTTNECVYSCCNVYLESGIQYTLYACLLPCTGSDCDDCPYSWCKAKAAVTPVFGTPCYY